MAESVFRSPGEGEVLENPVGGDIVFKVRGGQAGGGMLTFETVVPPGEGPPLHTHANEDETLYVLEGDVRFKLGDELRSGSPGSFAFIPRGTPHTWQNAGAAPARMLIHFAPAGMERFFEGFAALESSGPDAFAAAAARAGMEVVGPPLSRSDPL
jgi:quercetin dioxygenase-like cupin family protein